MNFFVLNIYFNSTVKRTHQKKTKQKLTTTLTDNEIQETPAGALIDAEKNVGG